MERKFEIQVDLSGHQSNNTVMYLQGELTDTPEDETEILNKFKLIKSSGTKTVFIVCSSEPHNRKIFGSTGQSDFIWQRMVKKYLGRKRLIYLIGALEYISKQNDRT